MALGTLIERPAWDDVLAGGRADGRVVAVTHRGSQPERHAPMPGDVHPAVVDALRAAGIERLYAHQARAWDAATRPGSPGWILTTGTASGKSLAYWLPVLDRLARAGGRGGLGPSRALYLAPTKALAQDQVRALTALGAPGVVCGRYDGDTPPAARGEIRRRATVLFSNPDMLHVGLLGNHARWADWLGRLDHVVVDEAHVYRGVFGSHVANVLRRLRRACARYGATPRFLLASATVANPGELARELTGLDLAVLADDGAPRQPRRIVLWNPPRLVDDPARRRSSLTEAAELLAGLVRRGVRTLCFVKSRQAAELLARAAARDLPPELARRISPYRSGYTAAERRRIEADLSAGRLLGVVATEALELGIDVGAVEAAISVGFPGTIASLNQQWGRAGRVGPGLALLVASDDMLDQYWCAEPEQLLERPVEAATLDPANPFVRDRHLRCAAFEEPLTGGPADAPLGGDVAADAARLVEEGALVATPRGAAVAAREGSPAAQFGLRSGSARRVQIVDARGEIVGTVDSAQATSQVHPGAVYLHRGRRYLVDELQLGGGEGGADVCLVADFDGRYHTEARQETDVALLDALETADGGRRSVGRVRVSERVTGFARRQDGDNRTLDVQPLDDLPPSVFTTEAVWWTVDDEASPAPLAALHAWEHCAIGLLGAVAMCDRWDLGGLSTDWHPDTDAPTVIVYEGHEGGVGLARRGFAAFARWQSMVERVLTTCPCPSGCPSCVQSPKCGNLNEYLDKAGALAALRAWDMRR